MKEAETMARVDSSGTKPSTFVMFGFFKRSGQGLRQGDGYRADTCTHKGCVSCGVLTHVHTRADTGARTECVQYGVLRQALTQGVSNTVC